MALAWRLGPDSRRGAGLSRLALRWEGRVLEAELELRAHHALLAREGRRFEAEVRRVDDWIEIRSGDRVVRCGAVISPRGVWVAFDGRSYLLERAHREAAAPDGAAATDEIRAPMTGRVVAVAAHAGDPAREGDLLLTIEAMKMEFRLTAPEDGTVAEVLCAEGDRVELGQLLVKLLPGASK
jgi:acetyl/propionyl-CoA carboxylase alpha subunit